MPATCRGGIAETAERVIVVIRRARGARRSSETGVADTCAPGERAVEVTLRGLGLGQRGSKKDDEKHTDSTEQFRAK